MIFIIQFKHNHEKGKKLKQRQSTKEKKKLANLGQNAEKCLHVRNVAWLFSQQVSSICRHTVSRWLTCAIFFCIKISVLHTTAVITLPSYVNLKCQLYVYNGFPMKTGLLTIL
jgi:hypothetical protein